MEKMIYHGSDHIIEHPEFGYGKTYNDYGTGFYCTENPNMAKNGVLALITTVMPTNIKLHVMVFQFLI